MDVILLEKLGRFGGIGDRASVKAGYGRNYLVPRGKAVFATEKNIAEFESRRAELEANAADKLRERVDDDGEEEQHLRRAHQVIAHQRRLRARLALAGPDRQRLQPNQVHGR